MKIERTTNTDKLAIELARDLITHPNYTCLMIQKRLSKPPSI